MNNQEKFPVLYDLSPNDFYKSARFKPEIDEPVEITADKPIQVRINNGPWVNVRPSDLNNEQG